MASRVDAVMPAVTVRNGDRNDDGKEGDDELQASLVPAMLAANKEDDGELRREVNALECAVVEAEDRISLLLSQMLALERELQEPWHPASCLCLTVEGGTATAGSVAVETGTGTGSGRTCVHVGGMRLAALPDPSINLSWDEIGGGWSALAVHLTLLSNALSIPIPLPDAATATSAAPVHVTQTHQHQHQHQQHRPASAQYPVEMPRSFAVRALRRYAVAVQYSPTFEAVRMDGRVSLKLYTRGLRILAAAVKEAHQQTALAACSGRSDDTDGVVGEGGGEEEVCIRRLFASIIVDVVSLEDVVRSREHS